MVAYLWLVWYQASSRASPKHWALAVTYELHERAYATFYEVSIRRVFPRGRLLTRRAFALQIMGDGNGMGQYLPTVVRRVHLTGTHGHQPYDGKLLLGEIDDRVLGALEMYGETAVELVNSQNRRRGLGESNCQVSTPAESAGTPWKVLTMGFRQDWAIIIIRSLEDSLLLPRGTLAKVEKCPRFG